MNTPQKDDTTEKILINRPVQLLLYLMMGLLGLGTILGAINDAISIVTPLITYVFSIVMIFFIVFNRTILSKYPISWRLSNGSAIQVKKLGIKFTFALFGAILLLWLPRVIPLFGTHKEKASIAHLPNPCLVQTSTSSDVLSRVYLRGVTALDEKEQMLLPSSQELFYEWKVSLVSTGDPQGISFEILHLQEDDRVSISPANAGTLSEPIKRWFSGYPEPRRTKPDYFARIVTLPALPAGLSTSVMVRRPLEKPLITRLITMQNARSLNCRVESTVSVQDEINILQTKIQRLAENVYRMNSNSHGVPLRPDPGDVTPQEIQGTIEVRCKDQTCTKMNMGQLEARMGKSPAQIAQEKQLAKIQSLKKDLKEILGCIEEPAEDSNPGREIFSITMCDKSVKLTAKQMQQLASVFRRHQVQLTIQDFRNGHAATGK